MKSLAFLSLLLTVLGTALPPDRLITRNGSISFYSKAALENIEANTKTAASVLDKKTGQLEFSVLIKSFMFEKALMQEHFNENYLESDKFPKSAFKGKIDDISKVNFDKDGKYTIAVTGQLSIHGETKTLTTPATITIQGGITTADANFNISLADYRISIPSLAKDKISNSVKITVRLQYEKPALPLQSKK
jgi:polyisoprenoid-binding protein YceI